MELLLFALTTIFGGTFLWLLFAYLDERRDRKNYERWYNQLNEDRKNTATRLETEIGMLRELLDAGYEIMETDRMDTDSLLRWRLHAPDEPASRTRNLNNAYERHQEMEKMRRLNLPKPEPRYCIKNCNDVDCEFCAAIQPINEPESNVVPFVSRRPYLWQEGEDKSA